MTRLELILAYNNTANSCIHSSGDSNLSWKFKDNDFIKYLLESIKNFLNHYKTFFERGDKPLNPLLEKYKNEYESLKRNYSEPDFIAKHTSKIDRLKTELNRVKTELLKPKIKEAESQILQLKNKKEELKQKLTIENLHETDIKLYNIDSKIRNLSPSCCLSSLIHENIKAPSHTIFYSEDHVLDHIRYSELLIRGYSNNEKRKEELLKEIEKIESAN